MFSIDQTIMLLIDVQGRLAQIMYEKQALFNTLQTMIQSMQILGVPILWMEQIPDKLGATSPEISQYLPHQTPIAKHAFSCCGEPVFVEKLQQSGKKQVLLTGIETHICVFQTGYDLLQQGFQVQVVSDCVSSRTRENKTIGLERLAQNGAQVTSLEMCIFELMKAAKGDPFRQVVKLIK